MGIFTNNTTFDLISLSVTIVVVVLAYLKWKLSYWNRVGLKSLPTASVFGNCSDLLLGRQSPSEQFATFYQKFKAQGLRHAGVYMSIRPCYIPIDPEIIKNIMQKDFQHFTNHGNYVNEHNDPLSGNLFNLNDAKWKNMRVKLTPTFTSGKMKMMFHTMADCAKHLKDVLNNCQQAPVDIKEILSRFTTDVIGSCAFGIECNSLMNPNDEFRKYGKRINENTFLESLNNNLQLLLPHKLLDLIKYKETKPDVEEFIMNVVTDTVEYREKNQIHRKDFMHLLLQLKNRGSVAEDEKLKTDDGTMQKVLSLNEVAAQCFVFFVAGFETSATTMAFALFELGMNLEIQEKLRHEVNTVLNKYNNELSYDAIMEMTYMDRVINETLRKFPPLAIIFRRCTEDYTVPGTAIRLERGTQVLIPAWGLHKDPEYYPDPEKFDPERFTEDEKRKRPNFTFLPFGEGPRICIGMRFGLMQTKIGLATILKNFKVKVNSKTKIPLQMDKLNFITSAKDGIWLDIEAV